MMQDGSAQEPSQPAQAAKPRRAWKAKEEAALAKNVPAEVKEAIDAKPRKQRQRKAADAEQDAPTAEGRSLCILTYMPCHDPVHEML